METQLPLWQTSDGHERRPLTVRELPESEHPVNRLQKYGPGALSNTELLALLLGNAQQLDAASRLLASFEGLAGVAKATPAELEQQPGIGAVIAVRIKAAFELGRRLIIERNFADRPQVFKPQDAANLLIPEMSLLDQEQLRVMLLDSKHHVLAVQTIYVGSVHTVMVRVSEIFRDAIRRNCPAIIVAHNHPSGDPTPSPEDVTLTKEIAEAGKLMDIQVVDHLIIGSGHYVSMKERGLGFNG